MLSVAMGPTEVVAACLAVKRSDGPLRLAVSSSRAGRGASCPLFFASHDA